MALQVWLPLNKDFRNQGLRAGITVTNNGTTFVENGSNVFNGCYHHTATQNFSINGLDYSKLNKATVALWAYYDAARNSLFFTGPTTSYYLMATANGTGGLYNGNAGSPTFYVDGVATNTPGAAGGWHHYCVTNTNLSSWTGTTMKFNSYNSSWNYAGKVADIRIYDHVLTAEEVKELARNKIFDVHESSHVVGSSVTNYLAYANNETGLGWSSYGFGSKGAISFANDITPFSPGNVIKVMANGGSGNYNAEGARWVTATALSNGKTATFSFYAKGVGSTIGKNVQAHIYNNSGSTTVSTGTYEPLTAEWKRYSHTMTWTGSTLSSPSFSVYIVGTSFTQGEYLYACNFQFEIGSEVHPYQGYTNLPTCTNDIGGTGVLFNHTAVTKSDSGLYFNGSSSIMSFDIDFARLFDSNYTFSFWVKSEDATSSRSIYFGCGGQGNGWTLSLERLSSSLIFRAWNDQKPDYTESNFKINNNEWTHIGFVKSGSTAYSYKNGVLAGSNSNFQAHTLFDKTYYLGGDYRLGDILYKGYLSEFKLYAKALTAAEVLDIYNKEKKQHS